MAAAMSSSAFTPSSVCAQQSSIVAGKVFAEEKVKPVVNAQVLIVEVNQSTVTNDKGAFVFLDLSPGFYTLRARAIGFARFEARFEAVAGGKTEVVAVLPAVPPLDTVRVVSDAVLPLSFYEHKSAGLGHFITRDQLASQEGMRLSNVLPQLASVGFVRGRSGQVWIMSKRFVAPLSATRGRPSTAIYNPSAFDAQAGMVPGCYARVYLDKHPLNPGLTAEPVDINEYLVSGIEAVEFFTGPAQAPSEYQRLNSACGVLVLHTRRRP